MRKSSLILLVLFGLAAVSSTAIGTLSWFISSKTFNQIDIDGNTAAAYFAYGNGQSAGTAYGIKTPRQLYNLAWLQYNGTFNKDTNSDHVIDRQYYFELANDIDMTGWTLPPIGTDDNPFLGTFDGKGHTISGLTVSNKSDLTKPNAITYNKQPEIVGLFGVVGDGVKDIDYTYNSSINTIKNTTIKNITVESKTTSTLIGLAAGYVNADMSGVKVDGNATLDINDQTHTAKSAITDKITDYGLVGYSTKVANNGTYSQKLSEYYNSVEGSGGGEGDDWGGSLNSGNYMSWIYDNFTTKTLYGNVIMEKSTLKKTNIKQLVTLIIV